MSDLVYLLVGEQFLVGEALDHVRAEVGTDFMSEDFFDSDLEPAVLMSALGTSSLLGGRRLVIIRDADSLKKNQAEALAAYIETPFPETVLVLLAGGRTKLDAAVKKSGKVVALEAPKGRRLVGWLRERAGRHALKLDERGAWALIDAVGTELRDLDGALTQLSTSLGEQAKVGTAEVKRTFPRLADERIWAFTDAVGDRRIAPAMTALRRLLDQGEEPLVLFGALSGQVRRMLMARRIADSGPGAVAQSMGLPTWRAERLARQARAYREEELVDAMGVLASTDVELKGGDLPPEAALERALVQIVS